MSQTQHYKVLRFLFFFGVDDKISIKYNKSSEKFNDSKLKIY